MSVRRFGKSWYVDISWQGDRRRLRSPDNTIAGARAFEQRLRRTLAETGNLEALDPTQRPSGSTFAEFAERWLRDYVDVNNGAWEQYTKRRVLRVDLLPCLGPRTLGAITAHDIEIIKRRLVARGARAKTVNNTLAVLRKCLATAMEWGELDRLPKIRPLPAAPPPFRFLEPPQVERVLAMCDPELHALVLTAARTGLRWSELAALEWRDINFGRRLLTVARATARGVVKAPKNGRVRYVPLTSDVVSALEQRARTAPLIFHSSGRPLAYTSARKRLMRACRAAGVMPISWHALRHTYATHLSSAGAPLKAVQDLLGHATLTMTMRYAHVSETGLRAAVALLEPGQRAGNDAAVALVDNRKTALSSGLPWSG